MQSLKSAGVRQCQSRSTGSSCCHPVELIKLTESTLQEMAACLFSQKRRSKGHEQELREDLVQSPRIGIENYSSRRAFAIHLCDSHSSTFSDLANGFSRRYATLSHARLKEKGRDKKSKNADFTYTSHQDKQP